MYAPFKDGGSEPCITLHSVGGSSLSTGAKFWERTCFGSTDGLTGGSMKVLIMSSNALKISAGTDGSTFLFVDCKEFEDDDDLMEDGVWEVVFGGGVVEVEMGCVVFVVWVCWGFSSILTLRIGDDDAGGGGDGVR